VRSAATAPAAERRLGDRALNGRVQNDSSSDSGEGRCQRPARRPTTPLGRRNPCGSEARHWSTVITGEPWRTAKGLRIGDPSSQIRRLYPSARLAKGGFWWLVMLNYIPGTPPEPALRAKVRNGRVVAFYVWFPAGGI
jgi:hypothetical protein